MAISAKYASVCSACNQKYPKGTTIQKSGSSWTHYPSCPDATPSGKDAVSSLTATIDDADVEVFSWNLNEFSSTIPDRLKEVEAAIKECERQSQLILDSVAPKEAEASSLKEEATEVYNEAMVRINQLNQLREEILKKLRALELLISHYDSQRATLNAERAQILDLLRKQKEIDELLKSVEEVFANSIWGKIIHPYQREDILFGLKAWHDGKAGIINANVMGAGKTLEAIATLEVIEHKFIKKYGFKPTVLWITKKSLRFSTKRELSQWVPDRWSGVIDGTKKERELMVGYAIGHQAIAIVNYEMLNTTPAILEHEWDIVVMDEVHKLKGGPKVKLFHKTRELLGLKETYKGSNVWEKDEDNRTFFIFLSGSPIQNKAEEMWGYLHLANPERFPTVRRFIREYCKEVFDEKKNKYVPQADNDRIIRVLKDQVIRQDPKLVRSAWPDKTRLFYYVELGPEQREHYNFVKNNLFLKLQKQAEEKPNGKIPVTAIIAQLTRLRQIAVYPAAVKVVNELTGDEWQLDCEESAKLDLAVDKIGDLVDEGEQVVVWSAQFNPPLFALQERLKTELNNGITSAVLTSAMSDDDIDAITDLFRQGDIDVLLCNRMKVSEGLNLHKNPAKWPGGSSNAIFLDLWWNPKANEQAEDRIWRTGAVEPVTIHIIQADNTVDEFIAKILEDKEKMFEGIFGDETSTLSSREWLDTLEDLL